MSEVPPACAIPGCDQAAVGRFRESPLCRLHLEIARVWEWIAGGPVRLPTITELKQARGSKGFAEYVLDYFLSMNVKYGAVDFSSRHSADNIRRQLHMLIRARKLRVWTFLRGGSTLYKDSNEKSILYLVRDDIKDNTHK